MVKDKYSIADIALMTSLSDRTIRTYNFDDKNKTVRLIVIGSPDKTVEFIQKCMP